MAGLIREEDIAEVREKSHIDDVVSAYVTLRNAGGGSMKGLCPFHDEKTASFHVTPSRGFWHCFGCNEGGDVISFLMKMDGLSFSEAVERLAEKYGVVLRRDDSGRPDDRPRGPRRSRLIEANAAAQEFYAEQLRGPDAMAARQFLAGRQFDQAAAEHFGLGFAPRDGEALTRHLRGRRFTDEELVAAGLTALGRSAYDRFRGRLLWPIREPSGDTIGFGARRLYDDDRVEAKYLNTPETILYKKSQVLYGIDLARKPMGLSSQAVVVEGYTDVMACHLAGVTTAVASCGTAFGEDHGRLLRRFLADHDEFRGEVIFTFDGDAAGRNAALKQFETDQKFAGQTYVAIEPNGLDPCDLRLQHGDAAVRELVAKRIPLYRFVLQATVSGHDLDRADGRVDALRAGARLVSAVRDRAKVDAFARELAGMVGVDIEEARAEVRRASRRGSEPVQTELGQRPQPGLPDLRDPRFALERDVLKLVLQHPEAVGRTTADVGAEDFLHPTHREVWAAIVRGGGPSSATASWSATLQGLTQDPAARSAVGALSVEPVRTARAVDATYVQAHVARLQELTTMRRITDLKSRLQRTNPVEQAADYNKMFGELVALEQHRRALRESAIGAL